MRSALCQCALDGNLEGARYQIGIGAPVDGTDCAIYTEEAEGCITGAPYCTPLGEAARMGHAEIVTTLLDAGAPIDKLNYRNETALILAASHDQPSTVEILLARGADVHHVFFMGNALSVTQPGWKDNSVAVVKMLVDAGVSPVDAISRWIDAAAKQGEMKKKVAKRYLDAFQLVLPKAGSKAAIVEKHIAKFEALSARANAKKSSKR